MNSGNKAANEENKLIENLKTEFKEAIKDIFFNITNKYCVIDEQLAYIDSLCDYHLAKYEMEQHFISMRRLHDGECNMRFLSLVDRQARCKKIYNLVPLLEKVTIYSRRGRINILVDPRILEDAFEILQENLDIWKPILLKSYDFDDHQVEVKSDKVATENEKYSRSF